MCAELADSPEANGGSTRSSPKLLFAFAIFLSAFLLFQVQPLIAKIILPWFGGGAAVWIVCLLFFQVVLLFGYLYAHVVSQWLAPRPQRWVHALVVVASLLALPILPKNSWTPSGPAAPAMHILLLLAVTVGLPYFLLSSTSPLLQVWYARTQLGEAPYQLYALSNAGSMLALLSYPVLIEPNLSTSHQAVVGRPPTRAWRSCAQPSDFSQGAEQPFVSRRKPRTGLTGKHKRSGLLWPLAARRCFFP
jgi:hypothetical protein